jgi:hypothetical protein
MTNNELINLYRNQNTLSIAGDTAGLAALMTPDFYLVHMTGMKQSKAEWLAAITDGSMQYHGATEDHLEIVNNAEIIGQSRVHATIWGTESTWRLQLHLYCIRQNGQLLIQHIIASTY